MRMGFLAISIALALGGCAGSPVGINSDTPQQLMAENSGDLCRAYAVFHKNEVLQELIRRGAVRPDFVVFVRSGQIAIGMNQWEVRAVQQYAYSVNRTVTSGGVTEQWVYANANGLAYLYVYFTNGIVTAYQD